jgi:hypothetical protein
MQANAAEDAANAQKEASDQALAEQKRQYDVSRADLSPWREEGRSAVRKLSSLLGLSTGATGASGTGTKSSDYFTGPLSVGLGPNEEYISDPLYKAAWDNYLNAHTAQFGTGYKSRSDMDAVDRGVREYIDNAKKYGYQGQLPWEQAQNATPDPSVGSLLKKFSLSDLNADPVYQTSLEFGLNEGRRGIENMARARGRLNSGATLKELTKFGTDYGGTKAADSYNRFVNDQTNIYNRLAGVAGTGQQAATTTAGVGQNTANNVGNIITAQGNARGAASLAQGNAYGQGFSTIGNYYNQQQTLDKVLNRNSANDSSYRKVGNYYGDTGGTGGDYNYGYGP